MHRCIWVHRTRTQGEGVDSAQHFRDREGSDVTELATLARSSSGDTGEVTRFFHRAEVVAHVVGVLVARRVLEAHIWVLRGDFKHRIHVSERGSDDQVVTIACEFVEHGGGFCTFRNEFESSDLDAELLFHVGNALVVHVAPTQVARCGDVHHCGLDHAVVLGWCRGFLSDRFGLFGDFFGCVVATASCGNDHRCCGKRRCNYLSSFHSCSPFWCVSGTPCGASTE